MIDHDLCHRPATELARMIATREVSARELLRAHLQRIEAINPAVNAIVTLVPEQAEQKAFEADEATAAGRNTGRLHGLPVLHKDLTETKGIRTTYGSPAKADNVPKFDSIVVERLIGAGAITLGKTNTPEWGTGSQTFNPVFGATRNPYALDRTAGGSSGGSAAALASGMSPIADGSDMGGSLRNPASFCNVVGLRPSVGRVPVWPSADPHFTFAVAGPMARTVSDVALLMQTLSGPDPRWPYSHAVPARAFAEPLGRDFAGVKIAWSTDLGALPVDSAVRDTMLPARQVLADLSCSLTDRAPNLADAEDVFRTWRAWYYALTLGDLYRERPTQLGASAAWNVECGLALTGADLVRAQRKRTALLGRMHEFFSEHEFLVTLVSQVVPFDVNQPFPAEVAGVKSETYLDWMRSAYWISATGHPAASVPFGFTAEGLPVGIQVVGRAGDDVGVLQLAYAVEQATQTWRRLPALITGNSAVPVLGSGAIR